jgi:hypothetical protein
VRVRGVGIVASLLFVSGAASAQSPPPAPESIAVGEWQLTPLLQLRTRGEYRRDPVELGGATAPSSSPTGTTITPRVRDAVAVLERARLGLGADRGALRAQLTLQDARAWGSPSPSAVLGSAGGGGGGIAALGLYEGYVEARTSAARPSFVRLGRQAITWGDGRLVGNADWSPTARTLDAIRGRASVGAWDFELLGALLATPRPLGVAVDDTAGESTFGAQLYGAQVGLSIDPLFKIELSGLARIARGATSPLDGSAFALARASSDMVVGSLRIFGEGRGWRYAVEGAYELGRVAVGDRDVSAYAGAAYVEKKLDTIALAPSLRLAADFATGDDGSTSTYKQFDPLLPDVHTNHGAMDILAWSNAAQLAARVAIVPWTDGRAGVEYRYARMVESGGDWLTAYLSAIGRGTGGSSELGHEVDAFVGWRPWPALDITGGYSAFAIGDGARDILASRSRGALQPDGTIAPASLAHHAYLQVTLDVP